jgi:hypothetical protein
MTSDTVVSHTPGPWTVNERGHVSGKRAVAELYYDPRNPELEANARLIAAAPELLEELRNLEWWLTEYVLPAAGNPEAVRRNLRAIRAAITKAEGQRV